MNRHDHPTVRTVAQRAGVSIATVSRVMCGVPGVTATQRAKVLRAVQESGYRWNPAISSVMSQMRHGRVAAYRVKIAWLIASKLPHRPRMPDWLQPYFEGACARAEQSSALLERFWLADPRLHVRQINEILVARGIRGLIVTRPHPALDRIEWSRFAVAALQARHLSQPVHVASTDFSHGLRLAATQLRARGYRRTGLMLHTLQDGHTRGDWRAAYLLFEADGDPHGCPPPVLFLRGQNRAQARHAFLAWVRKHRLDAVICCNEHALTWAREGGIDVPGALGLVHLDWHEPLAEWAGIEGAARQVAATAVDLITSQIARGESGFPAFQKEVMVKGHWVAGPSVRNCYNS